MYMKNKNDFIINILFKVKMTDIYIENYSEKSFVVLGETKPHKENIKKLGGKWNIRLRNNKMGWIFPISKKDSIEKYINNFKTTGNIPEIEVSQTKTFNISQQDLEDILKRLEKLEYEVQSLKNNDADEKVQHKIPRRRLLKTYDSKYEGRINRPYDED